MVGNPMHTEVSADASDYVSSLQTAINRTDELDQQTGQAARGLDRLGEDATSASARLNAFSASAMGATAATQTLSTATTASLLPAIGALSTTIVPLTAALGGLAAASAGVAAGFGAVIGTGAYAYGEQLASQNEERLAQINEKITALEEVRASTGELTQAQDDQLQSLREQRSEVEETTSVTGALAEEMQPVRDQLHETAMTLGSSFVPLIRDAMDAMPAFIRRMEEAIGPLQPFADALRDAGQVAFRVIPEITAQLMDMGRDALPAVRDLGAFIANNAVPALRGMGDTLGRVADLVPNMGSAVSSAVPALNEFGLTVLETVVPPAKDAAGTIMDLTSAFNELPEGEQELAISGSIASPALLFGLTKLSAIIPGVIAGLSALSPVATVAGAALGALSAPIIGVAAVIGALGAAALASKEEIAEAVDAILAAFQPTFEAVNDIVNESADEIEGVADSVMGAFDGLVNFFQTVLLPSIRFVFTKYIAPIVNQAMSAIAKNVGPVLSEISQTIDSLTGYATTLGNVMLSVWKSIDGVVVPIIKVVAGVIGDTLGYAIDQVAEGMQLVMNLVQGDFGAAFENLKDMLTGGLENALDVLGILKDGFAAAEEWLADEGPTEFTDAIGTLLDAAFDIVSAVGSALADLGKKGGEWLMEKASDFFDAVVDFFASAVIDGIREGLSFVQLPPGMGGGGGGDGQDGSDGQQGGGGMALADILASFPLQSGATGGYISQGGLMEVHAGEQLVPPAQVTDRGEVSAEGGGPTEVAVRFEGNDALVDLVRSEAEIVVDENDRQRDRHNDRLGQRGTRR